MSTTNNAVQESIPCADPHIPFDQLKSAYLEGWRYRQLAKGAFALEHINAVNFDATDERSHEFIFHGTMASAHPRDLPSWLRNAQPNCRLKWVSYFRKLTSLADLESVEPSVKRFKELLSEMPDDLVGTVGELKSLAVRKMDPDWNPSRDPAI